MNLKPARLYPAILAVAGALTIAACGSSSSGASKTTTTASSSRAKLAACLKQHGVTLPNRGSGGPPPSGSGGPPPGGPAAGGNGRGGGVFGGGNSKFAQAFKACGGKFGGARRFGGAKFRARFSTATLDKFVTCVDNHGYKMPKPNTSGNGPIFPRSIQSNKKFQTASKSCASILRPTGTGSASTTTSSS